MRRFGLGERVLKTALAAGLSWLLASLIPGNDHPYLAPLSAVLLMQLTIAQSVDLAIQRNIGIAIGVIVAVASFALFGVHAWSVSLVVLISLAAGIQLRLGQQAVQQVAVSALIVLLAGNVTGTFEYAFRRILDSIIGASVALVLNWLVVPPIHIAPASKAIERMAQDLSLALADLAVSLRSGMTRTRAEAHLKSAR
ncbi:MAG TPA: aromatic acid exporter family protein, partial [Thermomicrobiales bacterium]|nr:aromatic acid exporter family protein [Thermomicrobiales bacterium]